MADFIDYYELLELSRNANTSTIERVFRYLAKEYHPDIAGDEHREKFQQMVEGFEILRDPKSRARYDAIYDREQEKKAELVQGANAAGMDLQERYKLLSLLYAKRRRDYKQPGIGAGSLESMVPFPPNVLHFHLWYFREKGWIQREESGQFSITALGVDQVDAMNMPGDVTNYPRIEHRSNRLTGNHLPNKKVQPQA